MLVGRVDLLWSATIGGGSIGSCGPAVVEVEASVILGIGVAVRCGFDW